MSFPIDLLACPDCRNPLTPIGAGETPGGLLCTTCEMIYPIIDGIFVLLGSNARNFELESGPVQSLLTCTDRAVLRAVHKTSALLKEREGLRSWEWEDEEFWAQEYSHAEGVPEKNWNDRIWQRERLVARVLAPQALRGKTILDVGCGEGQNFRGVLKRYCDDKSLYLAVDISLAGLQLNRQRNPHQNAMYVLASANALPLRNCTVDALCYWGILHHTERRAATISEDIRLLRDGGYVFLHEALVRAPLLPSFLKPHEEESAHEERIPLGELREAVASSSGLQVVAWDEMHTALYTGLIRFFGWAMIRNKRVFWAVTNADSLLIPTLGRILPFLRAGALMLGARIEKPDGADSA